MENPGPGPSSLCSASGLLDLDPEVLWIVASFAGDKAALRGSCRYFRYVRTEGASIRYQGKRCRHDGRCAWHGRLPAEAKAPAARFHQKIVPP